MQMAVTKWLERNSPEGGYSGKKKKKNNSLIKETNTALLLHETPLSFSSYSEDEHDNVLSYGKNLSEDKQEI